jgi:hypothetical protein
VDLYQEMLLLVMSTTKPSINGRLFADKTGLTIPYLNVDYELSDRSSYYLVDEKFLFRNNALKTLSLKRKALPNGVIEHNNFTDWKLDSSIDPSVCWL